ncbi:MAG: 3-dehydroquinate synthase, partial [Planctomycetes bacterium]|nr:3-dehydroquinate synthase [Planctomycetota bacterium]
MGPPRRVWPGPRWRRRRGPLAGGGRCGDPRPALAGGDGAIAREPRGPCRPRLGTRRRLRDGGAGRPAAARGAPARVARRLAAGPRRGELRVRLRSLTVSVPGGSYAVTLGPGASRELPRLLERRLLPSGVHIVTDSKVARHHARGVRRLAEQARAPVSLTVVPAGERSKSVRELARIWRDVIRAGCDRRACMVALGGGVVGDLAGFAAASVLRGIAFVQMPTTLLAMVDASVGGKTGINLPEGKNLVGAFHQPSAVLMDLDFLRTLPEREARAGWAEVIKAAVIRDEAFFYWLEGNMERLLARDPATLAYAVEQACLVKIKIIEADERESDLRSVLNFGHTFGHALEHQLGYGRWRHGEAVAVGMALAADVSERLGWVGHE